MASVVCRDRNLYFLLQIVADRSGEGPRQLLNEMLNVEGEKMVQEGSKVVLLALDGIIKNKWKAG